MGSPLLGTISGRMVEAAYGVQFLLSLMSKDLHYAGLDAATLGLNLSMAKTAEERFIEAAKAMPAWICPPLSSPCANNLARRHATTFVGSEVVLRPEGALPPRVFWVRTHFSRRWRHGSTVSILF